MNPAPHYCGGRAHTHTRAQARARPFSSALRAGLLRPEMKPQPRAPALSGGLSDWMPPAALQTGASRRQPRGHAEPLRLQVHAGSYLETLFFFLKKKKKYFRFNRHLGSY